MVTTLTFKKGPNTLIATRFVPIQEPFRGALAVAQ